MRNLNKNYIKYISDIKKLHITEKTTNRYIKKVYNPKKKSFNKSIILSTCLLKGRLKQVYKNNNVSRHFIRDESLKNFLNIWEVKSW